jgi:hypothetical protein
MMLRTILVSCLCQELKLKRLEMAKLQIKLQQAENRRNMMLLAAEQQARKQREAEEFEAMKQRLEQLERMVAAGSSALTTKVYIPVLPFKPLPSLMSEREGACRGAPDHLW